MAASNMRPQVRHACCRRSVAAEMRVLNGTKALAIQRATVRRQQRARALVGVKRTRACRACRTRACASNQSVGVLAVVRGSARVGLRCRYKKQKFAAGACCAVRAGNLLPGRQAAALSRAASACVFAPRKTIRHLIIGMLLV